MPLLEYLFILFVLYVIIGLAAGVGTLIAMALNM